MINDRFIRYFFIPLLGIVIPLISGFFDYKTFSFPEIIVANSYSIFISLCVWNGSSWIICRSRYIIQQSPFLKIATLCFLTVLYSAAVSTLLAALWLFFMARQDFSLEILMRNTVAVSIAVIVFTLIYEILFLSSEKETEHSKTKRLDTALTKAHLTILKNELDPHFMYNALNTLSYLIKINSAKADDFVMRLAEIYKYFLANKNKEYVTLREELHFIDQYFFLLKLRYENKIQLRKELADYDLDGITILPCALQILVENAIKHNVFSEANPLAIKISISNESIYVVNTKRPGKIPPHYSTKVGLSNLKARYELAYKKPITVESGKHYFVVRLPLLKSA
jgi:LytS/YehU family sensor histidine kinase